MPTMQDYHNFVDSIAGTEIEEITYEEYLYLCGQLDAINRLTNEIQDHPEYVTNVTIQRICDLALRQAEPLEEMLNV